MTSPTLEAILTSKAFFGLTTASPLQRAVCRVVDGLPLGDLALDPTVLAAIGDMSALVPGIRPREVGVYSGIRTAKSLLAAAAAFRATQTVDVSHLGPGEMPRVSIVSLTRDLGQVVFRHLLGHVEAKPALRALVIGEPKEDRVVFRHPSGCPVEVAVVAASRAGGSLVARWSAGVVFDEAPRMLGEVDGAVLNLDDMKAAVEGRLLPGAQILSIGSPWAPMGPVYDQVQAHWRAPTRHLVVIKAPAPAMNPVWWTPERCADLQAKNSRAYRTDVLGEFASSDAAPFDAGQVAATARDVDLFDYVSRGPILVADPSSGRGDAFTFAVCEWVVPNHRGGRVCQMVRDPETGSESVLTDAEGRAIMRDLPTRPYLLVHAIDGIEGAFSGSISGAEIVEQVARLARAYGVERVVADQREALFLGSEMARHQLAYVSIPWTATSKPVAVERVRRWLADGQLLIEKSAGGDKVRRQLLTMRERFTASGALTVSARAGAHDDYAALLLTAAHAEAEGLIYGSPIARESTRTDFGDHEYAWG